MNPVEGKYTYAEIKTKTYVHYSKPIQSDLSKYTALSKAEAKRLRKQQKRAAL